MRVGWATDIHLDFLDPEQADAFFGRAAAAEADAWLVAGDIAEADSVADALGALAARVKRPVYFVLGNHDFYGSSIEAVRGTIAAAARESRWLRWLTDSSVVELTARTALVGHDSWGDGRLGSGRRSRVLLNDFFAIRELTGLSVDKRFDRLASLGSEAADHFRRVLPEALERFDHVLLVTHVPPFREACWHEGKISGDDFLPLFACGAVGEVLIEAMRDRPDKDLTVFCGHTHGKGYAELLPNLRIKTGGAEYGSPEVQEIFTVA